MRRHRKLKLLLGLFLGFALLAAACGDDSDSSEESSDTTSAACGGGGDLASADAGRVGLAYDLGGRGDLSFNDSAAAGLDQAVDELGIEKSEQEPNEGGENREELLRLLAEDGNGLVIGVGFLYTEAVTAAANDFVDTNFAIVDSVVECDNVANLVFAEEQGSFLVGAAAALTTQTGQIGFVGGVNNELIQKFQAGFEAGVAEIDPSIEVDVQYLTQPPDFGGFEDPAAGKEAAASMYADGADVVYHASGLSGAGVFEAASEAREEAGSTDIWAIGVDSDQYNTVDESLRDVILTSMLKRVDVAVFETINRLNDGEDIAGVNVFDLEVDGVGYSTSGDFMPQEVIDQLEDLKQQILDGAIEVPTTP